MKKMSLFLVVMLVFVMLFSMTSAVYAASSSGSLLNSITGDSKTTQDNLVNKMDSAFTFIVKTLLPLIGIVLLAISAIVLATGSPEGKRKVAYAMVGIFIITMAPAIVSWIVGL